MDGVHVYFSQVIGMLCDFLGFPSQNVWNPASRAFCNAKTPIHHPQVSIILAYKYKQVSLFCMGTRVVDSM